MINRLDDALDHDTCVSNNSVKIFEDIKKHGERVAIIAMKIGKKLKLNNKELDILNNSALCHDYGKYYIPHEILLKPSNLSMSEIQIMKKHVFYGSKIAIHKYRCKDISDNILYHHENYDGTGYYRVKGEFIPLISRILRIADVYDALTSDRPYRKALDSEDALSIMNNEKDYYDKNLYEIFTNDIA